MISLLLIISFLLHIVAIIAIYQLYQQMEKIKQTKNAELETLLLEFVQEMKAENKELEQLLKSRSISSMDKPSTDQPSIVHSNHDEQVPTFQQTKQDYSTYGISSLLHQHTEITELSEEGKMLQLDEKGYSADDIAKQLNKGKTEVALFLKLQQQLKQNT